MATTPLTPVRRAGRRRGACLPVLVLTPLIVLGLLLLGLLGWSSAVNARSTAIEVRQSETGAPGRFVTVDGVRLHVQEWGPTDVEPFIFLHGFNVNGGYEWEPLRQAMGDRARMIVPDLPPFGHSQRLSQPNPVYTARGQAELVWALLDQLDVPSVTIVAASASGDTAVEMALISPDRVRRLVLISTDVYAQGGGIFAALGSLPWGIGRANTFEGLGAGNRASALFALGCNSAGYCPGPDVIARRQAMAEIVGTTDALMAANATPPDSRVPAALADLSVPVTVAWGDSDTFSPLEMGQRLAADIPGATLIAIPGGDHVPHLSQPEAIAELLLDLPAGQ
jgi:pimeloyl-ACP methyl ester carboxylesterase